MSGMRTVVWLLVGIVTAVAAHFAMDVGTDEAPRALRRNALVPAAENSTEFTIARQGEPVTRLSVAPDGAWSIVAPYSADANRRVVLRLADALAFSPISDEMTDIELLRLGRTRADFGLDRPRITVTVGSMGKTTVVSFGSATPAGDGVYATVGASDAVYVVSSNVWAAVDCGVADFRRRKVFSIDTESVTAFDVKGGAGRFSRIARDGEAWKLVEPYESVAASSRVRAFLDAVIGLEAQDFVWPIGVSNETDVASASLLAGYGLDPELSVTVTLKCMDGGSRTVSFGRESGKGCCYALVQEGRAIVTVPGVARNMAVADAFVDTRLFPLEASAVHVISVDDGKSVHLLSRMTGGVWHLDAPVAAAADPIAVGALIERMLALKSSDIVADGVKVSAGTNAEPVTVSRTALLSGVRLEDLRSKEILNVNPKLMKRIVTADRDKKPVAVVFDAEKGAWAVESAEDPVAADAESIAGLCSAINPLAAIRVARLKVSVPELGNFGLDKPVRTVAVDQSAEDSVRRNILIGDVTDGGRYATLGSSDAVFVISSESAAALLAPIAK